MSRARSSSTAVFLLAAAMLLHAAPLEISAYTLNRTVADKRNPANVALGACPERNRFDTQTAGKLIDRRWHTTLNANIRTTASATVDRQNEVEQVILESFAAWTGVPGTALVPGSLAALNRTAVAQACDSNDGLNSICFAQSAAFAPGVLAFTNTVTSDILGEQFPVTAPPSAFIGEILDADVLFNPANTFATPSALPSNGSAFDLESVLIHELGHFFGFGHSGVWGAMMYPFAPPGGQFLGSRPTMGAPDGPLSDDDRTGLRVLYPDPADTMRIGSIRGRVLPANPFALSTQPGVSGIFGAHVVAIDEATGAVAGTTLGGWSCSGAGPAVFDGGYAIEALPLGRSYRVYVEPLDGPAGASNVSNATQALCRNAASDPGWPPQFACTVPPLNASFTTRARTP